MAAQLLTAAAGQVEPQAAPEIQEDSLRASSQGPWRLRQRRPRPGQLVTVLALQVTRNPVTKVYGADLRQVVYAHFGPGASAGMVGGWCPPDESHENLHEWAHLDDLWTNAEADQ